MIQNVRIYPRNSLVIHQANRGFIVNQKGTREEQEDNLDGVFVFETVMGLTDWIAGHFSVAVFQSEKENLRDLGKASKEYTKCYYLKTLQDLVEFLQFHEDDIADDINDFGNLKEVYKELCGELPKPNDCRAKELFDNEQSLRYTDNKS